MILHIALVAEMLATFICIHCIWGRKFRLNTRTIVAIVWILMILEMANYYHLGGIFSFLGYVILCVYCKYEFKSSIVKTIVNFFVVVIVMTIIQFASMAFIEICIPGSVEINTMLCNMGSVICVVLLSKTRIDNVAKSFCKKNIFLFSLLSFMCAVALAILLQKKIFYGVQFYYFVLVVPAIIMILFLISKWYTIQNILENMEKEKHLAEEAHVKYHDLLLKVRLRQHEYKNHLSAILSTHYTYKTYDKLVRAQEEYCENMISNNKYNSLLLIKDSVLAGFLIGKFEEAKIRGITIDYAVPALIENYTVPKYHVVEMLGILLDNSIEALENGDDKRLFFEIAEKKNRYMFLIRNPNKYVPYESITEWFILERSEKGSGRGLGLYHLKCLCDEWNCDIICRNIEIECKNWIEFVLEINKADN